jgi:hypothetical protein
MEAASSAALNFANLENTDPNATAIKMGNVCHVQMAHYLASFCMHIVNIFVVTYLVSFLKTCLPQDCMIACSL